MEKNQFHGFVVEQAKLCNFCTLCKKTSSCKTMQGKREKSSTDRTLDKTC
jgi:hypothetical protein